MDRVIEPETKKFTSKHIIGAAITVGIIVLGYLFIGADSASQQQYVDKSSLKLSTIKQDVFNDTLNVRGIITPQKTIYLDAISGGIVEEKMVERGEYVKRGQPLIRLTNSALQLDVISREAQISEQLNFLRNTQINAETASLNLEREILDTTNQILTIKRNLRKLRQLSKEQLVDANSIEELEQNLDYFQKRSALNQKRKEQQEKIRSLQIKQLEESAIRLQENLEFARDSLKNLLIKAPVDGYLSELDIEIGELKSTGSRLGQIDIPGNFKLVAQVDEFYLNSLRLGMKTVFNVDSQPVIAQITKIDSRVSLGQFSIEIDVPKSMPEQLIGQMKRGQSLDIVLTLGDDVGNSMLLPKGAFYTTTGGNWVFVVDEQGASATRRNIKIGLQNRQYYQVISGLKPGDKVITSSYHTFDNADKLIFN